MRKRLSRCRLMLLGLGAAGAAVFFFIFMRPLPVEVVQPAENVSVKVFGLGTVEARILSKVGFEVGAAFIGRDADHGDRVEEGSARARLHRGEQEMRVDKSRAGIINAEAGVEASEASVGKAPAVLAQKKQTNKRKQALRKRQTVSVEFAEGAQTEEDVAAA